MINTCKFDSWPCTVGLSSVHTGIEVEVNKIFDAMLVSKSTKSQLTVDKMNIQFASSSRHGIQTFIVTTVLRTVNFQTFIFAKQFNKFSSSNVCPTKAFNSSMFL